MSNTIFLDISAALDGHLNTMASPPPIAWPNFKFNPVDGILYIRPTLLPATPFAATISNTSTDRNSGIYQIDIFSPADEGKNESMVMGDLLADRFYRDQTITFNGVEVYIISAAQRVIGQEGGWYQTAIDIEFYSFTSKRTA